MGFPSVSYGHILTKEQDIFTQESVAVPFSDGTRICPHDTNGQCCYNAE